MDALAGYGIASRLDWLLVPLLFGLGSAVVAMVGASTGAGDHLRARRVAWVAAVVAMAVTEVVGLMAAALARDWIAAFTGDPAVVEVGTRYMHIVGPCYGAVGLGLTLYFAEQGRARMGWPFLAGLTRLGTAAGGGLLLAHHDASIGAVFAAVAAGTLLYGALNLAGMRRASLHRRGGAGAMQLSRVRGGSEVTTH